jgi:hypothetical protein
MNGKGGVSQILTQSAQHRAHLRQFLLVLWYSSTQLSVQNPAFVILTEAEIQAFQRFLDLGLRWGDGSFRGHFVLWSFTWRRNPPRSPFCKGGDLKVPPSIDPDQSLLMTDFRPFQCFSTLVNPRSP